MRMNREGLQLFARCKGALELKQSNSYFAPGLIAQRFHKAFWDTIRIQFWPNKEKFVLWK